MADNPQAPTTARIMITFAAFIVIVAGMKAAASIIVPFLLSLFLAIICSAPASWLKDRGLPAWVAIMIVITGIIIAGVVLTGLVGASMKDFLSSLPRYNSALDRRFEEILSWMNERGLELKGVDPSTAFEPATVMQFTATLLNSLKDVLANGLLIIITVIFMLLEASSFPRKLRTILDDPEKDLPHFDKFTRDVKHYLAIKTWICLGTGILVTAFLMLIGVDYPILWGLLAFILNYIPTLGSIIAAIPAVLLSVVQYGWGMAVGVAAVYLAINLVMGSFVEPRVMGKGLGLSTLVVFLSLLFWGWVLGPVGMVLSVPLTVTVKIALESRQDTAWIAVMLGSA